MAWMNPFRSPMGDALPGSAYVVRSPAYLLWTLWGFGVSWLETRRMRRLLHGIPAVALAGVLIGLMLSSGREASRGTISAYLAQAQQARHAEDFDAAEFYFRKLEQLAPRDAQIKFEHAQMYAQQERYASAAAILQTLVRDSDRTNDTKVHLELARWAIEGRLELEDPVGFAKSHLNQVLEDDPKNAYAHYFYSELFKRLGDLDNAIRHLERVASKTSDLRLKLAAYYEIRGDTDLSRSEAKLVVKDLAHQIRENQSADINAWTQLAGAHLLMREYAQAADIMKEAVTKFDNAACRLFLGRIYVRWSDELFRTNSQDVAGRMQLLQQAILIAPDEPEALQRLVQIANAEGEGADEAQRWLNEALVDGEAPAVIHFILGTMAAGKGDLPTALRHLDQANSLNPRTGVTLNNLAFVLAHMQPPDLPRALEMSMQAVRIAPNSAAFLETRGQIYAQMGSHSEAITDLEQALKRITNLSTRINAHESLATCYEALGDAQLAKLHHEKAEELRAQASMQNDASGSSVNDAGIPNLDLPATPTGEDPPEGE